MVTGINRPVRPQYGKPNKRQQQPTGGRGDRLGQRVVGGVTEPTHVPQRRSGEALSSVTVTVGVPSTVRESSPKRRFSVRQRSPPLGSGGLVVNGTLAADVPPLGGPARDSDIAA